MSSLVPDAGPLEPVEELYRQIHAVLVSARSQVRRSVNDAMVHTYWQVGRLIVQGKQGGAPHVPRMVGQRSNRFPSG